MSRSSTALLAGALALTGAITLAGCSSGSSKTAAPASTTTTATASSSDGVSPSTTASSGSSSSTGPCTYLDASTADAYSGLGQPGTLTAAPVGTSGCTYSGPKGVAMTVTITDGPSAFGSAAGTTETIALLDQAKWDAATKTLTAVAAGKTIAIVYGPAATQSDDGIAGNTAQFVARKIEGK